MALDRKGFSTIVMIFIILAIALVGVTWYRANISAGAGQQEQISQQAELNDLDYLLQNFVSYMEEKIQIEAQKGTDNLASDAGRSELGPRYRYWMCNSEPQVPTVEKIKESLFSGWYININGLRFDIRNENSPISYLETLSSGDFGDNTRVENSGAMDGFDQTFPLNPDNDRFQLTTEVDEIEVSVPGQGYRTISDLELESNVTNNRFWYMYNTLKKWVMSNNGRNLTDNIKLEMLDVTDTGVVTNYGGGAFPVSIAPGPPNLYAKLLCVGQRPSPFFPENRILEELNQSVYNGLQTEMNELEESPAYFNNNSVSCSFEFNKKWVTSNERRAYPGFRVEADNDPVLYPPNTDGYTFCVPNPFGGGCVPTYFFSCTRATWQLLYEAYLDYTVTCTDNKYRVSPGQGDVNGLSWEIDLSYPVHEKSLVSGGAYYDGFTSPPRTYQPSTFNACNVDGDSVDPGDIDDMDRGEWCEAGNTRDISIQLGGSQQVTVTVQGETDRDGRQVCQATGSTVISGISAGNEWDVANYYSENGDYYEIVVRDVGETKRYQQIINGGDTTNKHYDSTGGLTNRTVFSESGDLQAYSYYPDCNLRKCQQTAGTESKFKEFWSNQSVKTCRSYDGSEISAGNCNVPNCDTADDQRDLCLSEST